MLIVLPFKEETFSKLFVLCTERNRVIAGSQFSRLAIGGRGCGEVCISNVILRISLEAEDWDLRTVPDKPDCLEFRIRLTGSSVFANALRAFERRVQEEGSKIAGLDETIRQGRWRSMIWRYGSVDTVSFRITGEADRRQATGSTVTVWGANSSPTLCSMSVRRLREISSSIKNLYVRVNGVYWNESTSGVNIKPVIIGV